MTEEFILTTIYIDKDLAEPTYPYRLNNEIVEWLHTNVGKEAPNKLELIAYMDSDVYDWCHSHSNRSSVYFREHGQAFYFKDSQKAMLFKLRWG